VLDSLHEDLNRVKVKPLVPMIESHGENDERASIEAWEAHLKRSQSIIVDLMHGQYKSTVRCPDCNHLSITFEAFNQIILPIPEIRLITKQFVWVPSDINTKCSVHKFIIKGHESIKNLRKYITYEILQKQDLCHDENGFEIVQINND
jgi:ubiquitin carboxyl-terminal hydrolase 4/11/15